MRFFPEKALAVAAFATALGGSLAAFPLILDNPAFALDAKGDTPGGRAEGHFPLPSEMVEPRLAFVKTALKITDAQAKQWNAVADVIRKEAKDRDAKMMAMRAAHDANPGQPGKFSPIDRMEQRQKMMIENASALGELIAAAKPLYASLSDDQKRVADHLLMMGTHEERHGPHGLGFGGGWRRDEGPDRGPGPGGGPAPH
jgi:hypothetical protein